MARDVLAEGRALNRREVAKHLPPEMLSTIPRLDEVLKEVQAKVRAEMDAGAQRPGG